MLADRRGRVFPGDISRADRGRSYGSGSSMGSSISVITSGRFTRMERCGIGSICRPCEVEVRCGTGMTSCKGLADVDMEGVGCMSLFSLLSAVSRSSSNRTLRAPVTLRCVLVRPEDIGCRTVVAAGVEICAREDDIRAIGFWVVVGKGTSARTTSGALSERDKELLGRGLGEGLGLNVIMPFSSLQLSFGTAISSSSDGVGEAAYESGLRASFSES